MLLLLKATLLLATACGTARLMRGAAASARHGMWSAAMALLLALPVLSMTLPALDVAVPVSLLGTAGPDDVHAGAIRDVLPPAIERLHERPANEASSVTALETTSRTPSAADLVPGDSGQASRSFDYRVWLAGVWLAGVGVSITLLCVALIRAGRVMRGGHAISEPGWTAAAAELSARLGLRTVPRVIASDRVTSPMAGGLLRATVLVPAAAEQWDAEMRDVVLAHEIAHLGRRDPLRQLVTRVALATYWFHPLAWLAARQAEAAREQACDEAVLALGTRPSTYARVLLTFADAMPAPIAALPIVHPSLLETRLMAILNDHLRPRARRFAMLPALAVAVLALPVAAARPADSAAGAPTFAAASPADVLISTSGGSDDSTPPMPAAGAALTTPALAGDRLQSDRDGSACDWSYRDGSSFSGSISISREGNREVVHEQVGRRGGGTRVMQKTFGDTRLCVVAEGVGDSAGAPSTWLADARRMVIETKRGNQRRTLEIDGGRRVFMVNGEMRQPDAESASWQAAVLAVADPAWELATLRGEESSLRGEISSIYGERSSLQGEISSLYGEVSSMRGEISSIGGEESSMRGEISSIYGELSSLEGEVSSARGEISSLNAERYDASDAERDRIAARIRQQEARIDELRRRIRDFDAEARVAAVERRLAAFNSGAKIAEVERRLRDFDVDARVRGVRERIAALDVDRRVADNERRIAALEVDGRAPGLAARLEAAVRALNR